MIDKEEPVASHWRNSHFQITYFLAGKCHTPDEMYRVLCQLYEERDVALKHAEASALRQRAKNIRAKKDLESEDETVILEARATLEEMGAFEKQTGDCITDAQQERDFILKLIEKVHPHRRFAHLPDNEAHQAAQWEEWKLELMWRAENYLLTQGAIPPGEWETMRLHPSFEKEIYPKITEFLKAREQGNVVLIAPKRPDWYSTLALTFVEDPNS